MPSCHRWSGTLGARQAFPPRGPSHLILRIPCSGFRVSAMSFPEGPSLTAPPHPLGNTWGLVTLGKLLRRLLSYSVHFGPASRFSCPRGPEPCRDGWVRGFLSPPPPLQRELLMEAGGSLAGQGERGSAHMQGEPDPGCLVPTVSTTPAPRRCPLSVC